MKIFNNRIMQDFDIYSKEEDKHGVYTVCGRSKKLTKGDVIEFPGLETGLQVETIERRDHRGVFKKPKDKKDSFFTVTCKQVNMFDIHEQLKEEENEQKIKD